MSITWRGMTQSMGMLAIAIVLALNLIACGKPDKAEILLRARTAGTRAELEAALGKPSDIAKLGPIEKWTYDASDGKVIFVITGDTVAIQGTDDSAGTEGK